MELGEHISLLGGDTYSFFLEVENISLKDQLIPAMIEDGLLDTSNYPKDHHLFSNDHKAQIGLVKDEMCGRSIREWNLLRPKCYSLETVEEYNMKRTKGVQRYVVANHLRHQNYLESFEDSSILHTKQVRIGSHQHNIYTYSYSKIRLNPFDDKRVRVEKNKSLAYGHHRLTEG